MGGAITVIIVYSLNVNTRAASDANDRERQRRVLSLVLAAATADTLHVDFPSHGWWMTQSRRCKNNVYVQR